MNRIILMALVFTGLSYSADAQKRKSDADQNFRICFVGGQYVSCDASAPLTAAGAIYEAPEVPAAPAVRNIKGTARKSRMAVAYDDPSAPYQGVNSQVNDGVDKNKERNINYQDNSQPLPPSDGGLSNRR